MAKIYLSLGGNIGDRKQFLTKAETAIETAVGKIVASSDTYETEPWGFEHSSFFLNKVVFVESNLSPHDLLNATQKIESQLGRVKNQSAHYSERIIDIDILFYEQEIINEADLIIPHPLLHERKFVLLPMMDIDPEYIHPGLNCSIEELYEHCKDVCEIRKHL